MAFLRRNPLAVLLSAATLCAVAGIFRAAVPAVRAAAPLPSADAVYAAFVVNLTRFITWPADPAVPPDAPFVIGTFPRDPINDELDAAVRGETFNGRPVQTIRLRSLEDVQRCHTVFVSRGAGDLSALLSRTQNRPILTISDSEAILRLGGHVRFVPQSTGTTLRVSVENLRASGLDARAQLLRIATGP